MLETGVAGSAHVTAATTTCLAVLARALLHTTWRSLSTSSKMTPPCLLVRGAHQAAGQGVDRLLVRSSAVFSVSGA